MNDVAFDVAVIGGGPAGSTAASYLAKAGVDVAVFEGEIFPRPHVGESLVPAVTPIMREIGVLEKIDGAGFPKKFGAAWTSAAEDGIPKLGFQNLTHDFRKAEILFRERDQEGVDRDFTYHVDRAKFDLLLLQHSQSQGAKVFQGMSVQGVDFSEAGRPVVNCRLGKTTVRVPVRLVLDASGRQTVLGNQLKLKVKDPVFNQYAIHAWFEGLDRKKLASDAKQTEFIFIHFLPLTNTWVWQIPISQTVTSIGVVTQKKNFTAAKQDLEKFFWECVASRKDLLTELRKCERVTPFRPEGDYSYGMKEICGDGFLLVGDAARFVDPIFSSGVSIAMRSAKLATQDVLAALPTGDVSKARFKDYETIMRRAVSNWYEFICLYYRLNILFTAFVQDPRYRIDVLQCLQGDFYGETPPPALGAMREALVAVESNPDHLWAKYLGGMTGHSPEFLQAVTGSDHVLKA